MPIANDAGYMDGSSGDKRIEGRMNKFIWADRLVRAVDTHGSRTRIEFYHPEGGMQRIWVDTSELRRF